VLVDGSSPGNPATLGGPAPGHDTAPGEGARLAHGAAPTLDTQDGRDEHDGQAQLQGQPTIYDVARAAGVSIASVSRVLNGRRNPLPDTRERVERAVAELGFIPDGAARALSARLKEVVGVVIRRPDVVVTSDGIWEDEEMSLQFPDLINRGIEVAAQRRDFNLLVSSVGLGGHDDSRRIFALARKSDGLILHDRVLDSAQLERLSQQVPVVTLAGTPTPTTVNVDGDNRAGMKDLARHLVRDHGYRILAYLGGHVDSPDNLARCDAFGEQVTADGAQFMAGPQWQGNYLASGGARVIENLLAQGAPLPQAIACANDQTALGVVYALMRHGIEVPGGVAITGFDDIPVARHIRPQLTTVRQPITDLGTTAFETLYSMITDGARPKYDIILPTRLIRRESCGCPPQPYPGAAAFQGTPQRYPGGTVPHAGGTSPPALPQASPQSRRA
jgi:LacI family transcriptional regulator, galactose operon repressor